MSSSYLNAEFQNGSFQSTFGDRSRSASGSHSARRLMQDL